MASSPPSKRRRKGQTVVGESPSKSTSTQEKSSTVVVFAHGAGASSSSDWMIRWKELLKKALNAVEVVTFDYPCKYVWGKKKGSTQGRKIGRFPLRIWVLWRKGIDLSIIQVSDQSITVKGGDFNVILHSNESSDHEFLGHYLSSDMKDFQYITQELELQDHLYFGPSFTWSNKQQNFDHCMAILWLYEELSVNKPKPFKFFNFWTLHPSFMIEVRQSWHDSAQGNRTKLLFLAFCYSSLAVDAQSSAPAPAPAPTSDGTSIDLGIAYAFMLVALVLTYLIHAADFCFSF
ncbi:Arabinogalactan peptide 20 [Hibiscus syriacus]|uniref:Arabinogalactan peptide 20 n=1 Tax=Hibiscus syriacus TaxID=106335 RepID=A0A6A2Y063_HIBSY|nr:Arabinogalactan peptide 20 [Hibiscus syriacus]